MDKHKITKQAFVLACKYLQKHPPVELDESDFKQLQACIGCNTYEAGWIQWAKYFLDQAQEELN